MQEAVYDAIGDYNDLCAGSGPLIPTPLFSCSDMWGEANHVGACVYK